MRWTKPGLTALCVLAATSCGKSEAKKLAEVRSCSAITMDAAGAANCLVLQYRWKKDQALTAARHFQHEQDSTAQFSADSGWRADAARHVKEIKQCAADPSGDVTRCLVGFGWAGARAKATGGSPWRTNGAKPRPGGRSRTGRKGRPPGAGPQRYYQGGPERAL